MRKTNTALILKSSDSNDEQRPGENVEEFEEKEKVFETKTIKGSRNAFCNYYLKLQYSSDSKIFG